MINLGPLVVALQQLKCDVSKHQSLLTPEHGKMFVSKTNIFHHIFLINIYF